MRRDKLSGVSREGHPALHICAANVAGTLVNVLNSCSLGVLLLRTGILALQRFIDQEQVR
jgi:hypothetical protein